MNDGTRSVIERFHEALNSHDLDALANLWSEDCIFEDTRPPDGTKYTGRDQALAACRDFFTQSPNAHFEIEELVTIGDRAFVKWRYTWPDGHVRGVDLMRTRDGKITESLAYVKG
ncbi:MAG TPA: nuclear transport factor 2 family protein [Microlunatus sp.]|nr:nuclear transport factor 2 family protein [Microlunatus sp.]